MTPFALAAVMAICLTALAALRLILWHLEKLHLTKTQAEGLESSLGALFKSYEARLDANTKDLEDTKVKLSALGNRMR